MCTAQDLDDVGRVIDFGVIKSKLCMWLENNWDHKMLMWQEDPILRVYADPMITAEEHLVRDSFVTVPFNPTAENMAQYLLEHVGPNQLHGTGVMLVKVRIEETRKCSATAELM